MTPQVFLQSSHLSGLLKGTALCWNSSIASACMASPVKYFHTPTSPTGAVIKQILTLGPGVGGEIPDSSKLLGATGVRKSEVLEPARAGACLSERNSSQF